MKLNIGICDDSKEHVELIKYYLDNLKADFEINIISSTNPDSFFYKLKDNAPDLLFLDIDMEETDGIELGKKIKNEYNEAIIIYITAYEKYALEAFQVRAFHYLIKPITEEKFLHVFKEAVAMIKNTGNMQKHFVVKRKGEYIKLNYNDIFYFEKFRNKIKVCTLKKEISFYGTFKELVSELDMKFFIRCHQGYIVNISKIKAYRDQILFLDRNLKKIPVSRSHIKKVRTMMEDKLFS